MSRELYEKGLAIRRKVLGDDYVDNALASADSFSQPLQEFVTTYCWGATWGREAIDVRTRSVLNVALLAALNRSSEFKLHLNGALNNGVTKEEIAEILLHVGVYCGIPAAVEAFRLSREVFSERTKRG